MSERDYKRLSSFQIKWFIGQLNRFYDAAPNDGDADADVDDAAAAQAQSTLTNDKHVVIFISICMYTYTYMHTYIYAWVLYNLHNRREQKEKNKQSQKRVKRWRCKHNIISQQQQRKNSISQKFNQPPPQYMRPPVSLRLALRWYTYMHRYMCICIDTCTRGQFVNALRRNCYYAYCNFRTWTSTRTTFSLICLKFLWLHVFLLAGIVSCEATSSNWAASKQT